VNVDAGTRRGIKRMRIIRAVAALAVALNAFIFAVDLSTGSPLVLLPPACIVALLVLIVMQTRLIGTMRRAQYLNWHAEQRELAVRAIRENTQRSCLHPDAKPVDLLLTGERVAWICPDCNAELPAGWTPQAQVPAESPHAACDCGKCDDAAREFDEQLREQVIASRGIPPAQAPERLTDSEVKDATEAAVHFAQLARVGRESRIGFCPICAERDSRRVTRSFADVKVDGKATERRIKDEAKAVARLAEDIATVKRSIEKMQREQP
jgi:hypothetical protein